MSSNPWPPKSADEAIECFIEELEDNEHYFADDVKRSIENCRRWVPETRRRISAMEALESLTPNGSEFVGDVEKCVAYIKDRNNRQHETIKELMKRCHAAEKENEISRDAIDWRDD